MVSQSLIDNTVKTGQDVNTVKTGQDVKPYQTET